MEIISKTRFDIDKEVLASEESERVIKRERAFALKRILKDVSEQMIQEGYLVQTNAGVELGEKFISENVADKILTGLELSGLLKRVSDIPCDREDTVGMGEKIEFKIRV